MADGIIKHRWECISRWEALGTGREAGFPWPILAFKTFLNRIVNSIYDGIKNVDCFQNRHCHSEKIDYNIYVGIDLQNFDNKI